MTIFPTSYFGPISYYKDLVSEQEQLIEIHETYQKQTIRNRMEILTSNGVISLTVPIIKPFGNKTVTKDIQIANAENWQKTHWRSIESAYKHAPFFEHYEEEVKSLIFYKTSHLFELNEKIIDTIIQWLQLPIDKKFTKTFEKTPEKHYRNGETDHPYKKEYRYIQVFGIPSDFTPNLSILDPLFNLGPMTRTLLMH